MSIEIDMYETQVIQLFRSKSINLKLKDFKRNTRILKNDFMNKKKENYTTHLAKTNQ